MSVKKESSGRRSVQVEVEVPGTPEEVWQAIATGPGISSWFVPAGFGERGGKPLAGKVTIGSGIESTSRVVKVPMGAGRGASSAVKAGEPPHKWVSQAEGWMPGMPPVAHEWSV